MAAALNNNLLCIYFQKSQTMYSQIQTFLVKSKYFFKKEHSHWSFYVFATFIYDEKACQHMFETLFKKQSDYFF